MAEVMINQNGQMVEKDTGKVLGSVRNGGFSFNSDDAPVHTLQEMGINEEDSVQEIKEEKKVEVKEDDSYYKNIHSNLSSNRVKTKYEVDKNSFFIIKFGLIIQQDGRFVAIRHDAVDDFRDAQLHWVKFRMWNYCEELQWKHQCTQYNNQMKSQIINQDKLNQKKIKELILDWSFSENEESLKLLHCDGKLSDESYSVFMGLYPSIATTIVDLMNNVLENNQ